MTRRTRPARLTLCLIVSVSILLSATGDALASAEVRLLHAVPGTPTAQLEVQAGEGSPSTLDGVGFGRASDYSNTPAGEATFTLTAGGNQAAETAEALEDGARYTVVAVPEGDGIALRVFADGEPTPGRTRWRMVHVAPELDEVEFVLADRAIGRLGFGEAGDYSTVQPGAYTVGARRPGEKQPLVERSDVSLVAGTAQTAYLVGSAGKRTRFAILEDAATAPPVAPATGLGGADSSAWPAALLAAALAGALGGAAFLRVRRD